MHYWRPRYCTRIPIIQGVPIIQEGNKITEFINNKKAKK